MQGLVLLPGMGATSAMYAGPWRELEGVRFLDWPDYGGERSVVELAERVLAEHGLEPGTPVGGTSLGGMVALELAARLDSPYAVLLSSARSGSEVRPHLRLLAPLARLVPDVVFRRGATFIAGEAGREADPRFLRAMCPAVVAWPGSSYAGPVLRVHGARDEVIRVPEPVTPVPGARHIGVLTHPREFLEGLRAELDRLPAESRP